MSSRTPSIQTSLDLWLTICSNRLLPLGGVEAQWSTILEEHTKPFRYYHTIERIETLCLLFQSVEYPDAVFPSGMMAAVGGNASETFGGGGGAANFNNTFGSLASNTWNNTGVGGGRSPLFTGGTVGMGMNGPLVSTENISYGIASNNRRIQWGPPAQRLAFPDELAFALFFHNIDFNPLDEDQTVNNSILQFRRFAITYRENFPLDFVDRVCIFIHRTRYFTVLPPSDQSVTGPTIGSDVRWLLDMLRCVFALPREEYTLYIHGVEKEMTQYHIHLESQRILEATKSSPPKTVSPTTTTPAHTTARNSIVSLPPASHRASVADPLMVLSVADSPPPTGVFGRRGTLPGSPQRKVDFRMLAIEKSEKEVALLGDVSFHVPTGQGLMTRRRYKVWRSKFLKKLLGGHAASVADGTISVESSGLLKSAGAAVPLLPQSFLDQFRKKHRQQQANSLEEAPFDTSPASRGVEVPNTRGTVGSRGNMRTVGSSAGRQGDSPARRGSQIVPDASTLTEKDIDFLGGGPLFATAQFCAKRTQAAIANIRWELSLLKSPETRNVRMTISDKVDFLEFENQHRENRLLRLTADQTRHILAMGMDLGFGCRDQEKGHLIACIIGTSTYDEAYSVAAREDHAFGGPHLLIHAALVHEDHRHCGIMTHMMREYIHGVRERHPDMEKISLICTKNASKFFERFGFATMRTAIIRSGGSGELEEDVPTPPDHALNFDSLNVMKGRRAVSPAVGSTILNPKVSSSPLQGDLSSPVSSSHEVNRRDSNTSPPQTSSGPQRSTPVMRELQQWGAALSTLPIPSGNKNPSMFGRAPKAPKQVAEVKQLVHEMCLDLTLMDELM